MIAENALIIFARKPEKGKVKTRLAATIGEEKALEIYIRLLWHTKEIAEQTNCSPFIFLTENVTDKFWNPFPQLLQAAGDLGMKMESAFQTLFEKGFKRVIIIGSDCPGLNENMLEEAFQKLSENDIVIGRATDDGYYLLGMKTLNSALFSGIEWSSNSVFEKTINAIHTQNLSFFSLPALSDVDEEKDLPPGWL